MSKEKQALVSVIVPAHNSEKWIEETIQCIEEQSYPNIEAFIIDDGSTDNTFKVAKALESDRVKVFTQKNAGACSARNHGIELSKGDYYQFLDADDLMSRDKIANQVRKLEENPGCMAMCSYVRFFDGEDPYAQTLSDDSEYLFNTDDPADFLARMWGGYGSPIMVLTHAWLSPRNIVESIAPWNEDIKLDQDGEYFTRAVLASKGLVYTDDIVYYRSFLGGSNIASQYNKKEKLESALFSLDLKGSYLLEKLDNKVVRKALASQYMELAVNAYPLHPELTKIFEKKIKEQGVKPHIPVMGGKAIEAVKCLLGWKAAKWIRYLYQKNK